MLITAEGLSQGGYEPECPEFVSPFVVTVLVLQTDDVTSAYDSWYLEPGFHSDCLFSLVISLCLFLLLQTAKTCVYGIFSCLLNFFVTPALILFDYFVHFKSICFWMLFYCFLSLNYEAVFIPYFPYCQQISWLQDHLTCFVLWLFKHNNMLLHLLIITLPFCMWHSTTICACEVSEVNAVKQAPNIKCICLKKLSN